MKGLVTDIQRFSLNDGDGIRTTVFLKGCNMNCAWCHNPETISSKPELMFYENKCICCGKCFEVCPVKAHAIDVGAKHIIDRDRCISCKKCAAVCFAEALCVCGTEMNVRQIMEQVCQDEAYYKNSGGGVTLSGGEVLCNVDFACEIADACHARNIHVAIESNIGFPFERAVGLLKRADMIMCDIKLFDDALHKKYTGVSNKNVLENIAKIDALGIPFVVRTPLIPDVTDSKENLAAIARHIKHCKNLKRYELLNFNPLGEDKYKGLGLKNAFENARPLPPERLSEISGVIAAEGVAFRIV